MGTLGWGIVQCLGLLAPGGSVGQAVIGASFHWQGFLCQHKHLYTRKGKHQRILFYFWAYPKLSLPWNTICRPHLPPSLPPTCAPLSHLLSTCLHLFPLLSNPKCSCVSVCVPLCLYLSICVPFVLKDPLDPQRPVFPPFTSLKSQP